MNMYRGSIRIQPITARDNGDYLLPISPISLARKRVYEMYVADPRPTRSVQLCPIVCEGRAHRKKKTVCTTKEEGAPGAFELAGKVPFGLELHTKRMVEVAIPIAVEN